MDLMTFDIQFPGRDQLMRVYLYALGLVTLVAVGCGQDEPHVVGKGSYGQVQIGMTLAQVEEILGTANEMSDEDTQEMFGLLEQDRFTQAEANGGEMPKGYRWSTESYSLVVLVADGEVVAKAEEGELTAAGADGVVDK